jgi:hypothetical protein
VSNEKGNQFLSPALKVTAAFAFINDWFMGSYILGAIGLSVAA